MLENREGKTVPNVTFKQQVNNRWVDLTTDEIFKGKRVVIFSLPGAFTPTCSSSHLPRYDELYETFKDNGIDEVYCLSVNDTFVMNAWAKDLEVKNVKLLPDGTGEFSKGMGMLVDKSAIGFGDRSWRYSMIVKDGVVEKMFIEPEKEGDPFEVSDADTLIKHLKPKNGVPKSVLLFTKIGCPFCAKAKSLLESKKMPYQEIPKVSPTALKAVSGRGTFPQAFIDGNHIGGSDDLEKWLNKN